ncbi:hypothetical protein BOTU111921_18170 [Bordetella tumbae]
MNDTAIAAMGLETLLHVCRCSLPPEAESPQFIRYFWPIVRLRIHKMSKGPGLQLAYSLRDN